MQYKHILYNYNFNYYKHDIIFIIIFHIYYKHIFYIFIVVLVPSMAFKRNGR